ncbi:MAG: hypothetical protein OXN21_02155 [Chloroflexota bacterium]|nr:hypothetical protein [Chloroflexota bacterium]MDE2842165.1 hypothetical protein [Chloroflexota bacterium]
MRKRLVEAALEAGRFALFGIVFVAVLGGLFLQSEGDLTYVTLAAAALGSLFISYLALMLLINSTGHNREVIRLLRVIAEEPPQDDVPTPSPRPARRKSRTLLAFLSGVAVGLLAVAALYAALLEADWAVGLWLPPLVVFLLVLVMSGIVYLLRRDNDARGLDGR